YPARQNSLLPRSTPCLSLRSIRLRLRLRLRPCPRFSAQPWIPPVSIRLDLQISSLDCRRASPCDFRPASRQSCFRLGPRSFVRLHFCLRSSYLPGLLRWLRTRRSCRLPALAVYPYPALEPEPLEPCPAQPTGGQPQNSTPPQ